MSTQRIVSEAGLKSDVCSWSVRGRLGTWVIVATVEDTPTVLAASLSTSEDPVARLTAEELRRYRGASRGFNAAVTAVRNYFDGDLHALDSLQVSQPGGDFMQQVWRHMRHIKPGGVSSYGALASRAGSPNAVRAAGSACARNRIPLIVPCHRVVRADGTLGNYYYGVTIKQRLLTHEGCALEE